jgi:hypothetical protein
VLKEIHHRLQLRHEQYNNKNKRVFYGNTFYEILASTAMILEDNRDHSEFIDVYSNFYALKNP